MFEKSQGNTECLGYEFLKIFCKFNKTNVLLFKVKMDFHQSRYIKVNTVLKKI